MGRSSPYVSLAEEQAARLRALEVDGPRAPVPFFILTGFLGAGKTTLLNRLLGAPQGRRIAVLVNDVGQINVDRKLIAADEGDIIELSGGCVCCKVDLQRDLFSGVDDLVERAQPDVVILETTGIADPRVLLSAFAEVEERRRVVVPSGVVCVVDAEVGLAGDARAEWQAQLEAADRIVVTKLERVSGPALAALYQRVEQLAPGVERAAFPVGQEGDDALARFLLEPRAPRGSATWATSLTARKHRHSQLAVLAFSETTPLALAPLRALVDELGVALVRCKGYAQVSDERGTRFVFVERAGINTTFDERTPPDADARTELVFIVEEGAISEEALRRRLWACRVGSSG